jgi:hypothetical protein
VGFFHFELKHHPALSQYLFMNAVLKKENVSKTLVCTSFNTGLSGNALQCLAQELLCPGVAVPG